MQWSNASVCSCRFQQFATSRRWMMMLSLLSNISPVIARINIIIDRLMFCMMLFVTVIVIMWVGFNGDALALCRPAVDTFSFWRLVALAFLTPVHVRGVSAWAWVGHDVIYYNSLLPVFKFQRLSATHFPLSSINCSTLYCVV